MLRQNRKPLSFNSNNSTSWEGFRSASAGSASIKVDGQSMLVGLSTEIISKAYNLSAFTQPVIKFSCVCVQQLILFQ